MEFEKTKSRIRNKRHARNATTQRVTKVIHCGGDGRNDVSECVDLDEGLIESCFCQRQQNNSREPTRRARLLQPVVLPYLPYLSYRPQDQLFLLPQPPLPGDHCPRRTLILETGLSVTNKLRGGTTAPWRNNLNIPQLGQARRMFYL